MVRNMLELMLSVFLFVCTLMILLVISNVGEVIEKYSNYLDAQTNSAIALRDSVEEVSEEYLSMVRQQAKGDAALLEDIKRSNIVVYEAGIALGARVMEAQGGMSPTDASEIINGSISRIDRVDGRLGALAKAFNDASRKDGR